MSILEDIKKHENLISRIKETIAPLQTKKLWNDDRFFKAVKDMFTGNDLSEEKLCKIIGDALFNLKTSQLAVEDVKKLIAAFPESLKCKNSYDSCLPIEQLTFYTDEEFETDKLGTKYISTFALEGLKHNVGGENMRGGLLCVTDGKNTLQRLSRHGSGKWYLEPLKDLRSHKLLIKKDIVDFNLLYHSCIGQQSLKQFRFFIKWDNEARTTQNYSQWSIHTSRCY